MARPSRWQNSLLFKPLVLNCSRIAAHCSLLRRGRLFFLAMNSSSSSNGRRIFRRITYSKRLEGPGEERRCSTVYTPNAKRKILKLFEPHILSSADVIGCTELNGLLRRYPGVERSNFKLWLTSSAVLDRVVHSEVFTRTEGLLEDIRRKLLVYVQSAAFDRALQTLDEWGVCIVSGIPGIGKTTLAEILLVDHISRGFEPVAVSIDISEAERIYKTDTKQVFFYDDFLGQTSLADKLSKNEDARLLKFMQRVGRAKNKRFILTTREYILAEAEEVYEPLARGGLDPKKCILALDDYTRRQRAQILYNHLYFTRLPKKLIGALLAKRQYYRIIDHENYSPRLIERVTTMAQDGSESGKHFVDRFIEILDAPHELWRHAFEQQLSPEAQSILLVLTGMPTPVTLDSLLATAGRFSNSWRGHPVDPHRMRSALKVLEGNFVSLDRPDHTWEALETISIDFHNPSVRDFMISIVDQDSDLWLRALDTALYFEHVETVWAFVREAGEQTMPGGRVTALKELKANPDRLVGAFARTVKSECSSAESSYMSGLSSRRSRASSTSNSCAP